jgi:triphosphoribosyl-dephospho-CoA synthase
MQEGVLPVPEAEVAASAATALTVVYSAPTPGTGSRYLDGPVAHESRVLTVAPVQAAVGNAARQGVAETVFEATLGSLALANFADPRAVAYLAPLARAALIGQSSGHVLSNLGHAEIRVFLRSMEAVGGTNRILAEALRVALGAGRDATLRDAMRFVSGRDPLAREYARDFEVTRELARPALLGALSRSSSARGAAVHAYLDVLSEVPDLDVAARAGRREAEEVSRMANGVLKAGGVHSRRGLEAIANLDGILRADPRLAPTATEGPVIAGAFLVGLEYGSGALAHNLRPATGADGRR